MRVRLSGDHSAYHCGCAAVWEVLRRAVSANGCEITADGDYDVLVMNGEGSMHHGRPTFHRKMQEIEAALALGKQAYLVNSVWDSNPSDYDHVLRRLSGISVREAASARDLEDRHGVKARICLDFSYFREVPALTDGGNVPSLEYVTDYLDPAIGNFAPMPDELRAGRQLFTLSSLGWDDAVTTLRAGKLLVTGRHHAVYAACRARRPFAAIEGNSHKITGLILSSGVGIPVARNIRELPGIVDWCRDNADEFNLLFDWMERRAAELTPQDILPRG